MGYTDIWVRERKPKTSSEAGRLADDYLQARRPTGSLATASPGWVEKVPVADRKCHNCGETGHIQWNCPKLVRTVSGTAGRPTAAEVKCYNCGTKGHLAMNCPSLYAGVAVPEGEGYPVD